MTNNLQRSISMGWAVVAICATLAATGCGPAMHNRGLNLFDGPLISNGPQFADDGFYEDEYYDEGYHDDGYYADSGYTEQSHGYDCFECGPGHPGPIRGLIHDMFHHRGPIAKTVQFLLCNRCGGNANTCGCSGRRTGHGGGQHEYGLFEKPPIAVENSVGPCWGYYQTAWRRFPPHCPNQAYPLPDGPLELAPEEIGPGANGSPNEAEATPPAGPSILPAPTNGEDGFQAANPRRNGRWQTAGKDNPMRDGAAQTRTAWKPPERMSWMPLRTADQRHWRKPSDDGTVVR